MKLPPDFHLAVIMDGNGRWGKAHGKSRLAGHEAGVERIRELFISAREFGVKYLTIYAFSTENWKRPEYEVMGLMRIFRNYIRREMERLVGEDVCVRFIGDKTPFAPDLVQSMVELEERTANNQGLHLNVGMNYGGKNEITRAVSRIIEKGLTASEITSEVIEGYLDTSGQPAVDLLIRTSGEVRISNFMIWQIAYAELYFTSVLWPDFDREELHKALTYFNERTRRFGDIK